jgi:hypothetical protein
MHDVTALSHACTSLTSHACTALSQWPGVRDLTLLNVSTVVDLYASLARASLSGLKSLTFREAPVPACISWGLWLGSRVAATIEEIDVSYCAHLDSICAVSDCVKLRCLRMPGVGVVDLSPLAACSETLEELWMADAHKDTSLVPLKACIGLRKLDVRDCAPSLHNQVADLQLALADPASVTIEGLVHELQPNIPPDVTMEAADALRELGKQSSDNKVAIFAAGAFPPIVLLLSDVSEDVQFSAARALRSLVTGHAALKSAVAASGAIPPLVLLLRHLSEDVRLQASDALRNLAGNHLANAAAISAAGAIPRLVQLLGPAGSSACIQASAASTLRNLAKANPQNQTAIATAGGIRPLVRLSGPGSPKKVKKRAVWALRALASSAANRAAIIAAPGCFPALLQKLDLAP